MDTLAFDILFALALGWMEFAPPEWRVPANAARCNASASRSTRMASSGGESLGGGKTASVVKFGAGLVRFDCECNTSSLKGININHYEIVRVQTTYIC